MLDPLVGIGARAARHADDAVALLEQQFCEVRAVLAGDTGDERGLHDVSEYIGRHQGRATYRLDATYRFAASAVDERSEPGLVGVGDGLPTEPLAGTLVRAPAQFAGEPRVVEQHLELVR